MCQPALFKVHFKLTVECVDDTHYDYISLIARRKGLGVIPPIGMHVIFGNYDVEVTGVSASWSFDVITCRCQIYKPLTYEQVLELIKMGWKEDLKQGEISKLFPQASGES